MRYSLEMIPRLAMSLGLKLDLNLFMCLQGGRGDRGLPGLIGRTGLQVRRLNEESHSQIKKIMSAAHRSLSGSVKYHLCRVDTLQR